MCVNVELGLVVGYERDWEVLDTCLNADDMKLVCSAYGFLKDRGFLSNFGKCRNNGIICFKIQFFWAFLFYFILFWLWLWSLLKNWCKMNFLLVCFMKILGLIRFWCNNLIRFILFNYLQSITTSFVK